METSSIKTIVFHNQPLQVNLNQEICSHFPQDVLVSFIFNNNYTIRADVSNEVVNSFIQYFNNQTLPNITHDNIDDYAQLNQEFQVPAINLLIQTKREFYSLGLSNINKLRENDLNDKSDIEHQISQNLDNYILQYGEELMKIPIQSLFNIFSNEDCHLTHHDLLYELIMSHHQITKNSNIFILLQFIDGNSISSQNLMEIIANKDKYYGFLPKITISNLSIQNSIVNNSNEDELFLPIYIRLNGLNYKLDHVNFTAKVEHTIVGYTISKIHIPRSIQFNSKDYLVTDLIWVNYRDPIEFLSFSEDSVIQKVDLSHFYYINYITIPPSVNELIIGQNDIKNIKISPNNHNFLDDGSFIYGKSKHGIDEFDTLIYAHRNIEKVAIQPNIKIIKQFCFSHTKLNEVNFAENSNLRCIDKYAFYGCCIKSISIDPNVISIAFNCFSLKTVEFSQNSKLRFIGCSAFENSGIHSIIIPESVTTIGDCAFRCNYLKTVTFLPNSNLQTIGNYAFTNALIESITIPESVTIIGNNSFCNCKYLKTVTFLPNSNLQTIGDYAFSDTLIESITIPKNVTKIGDYAFYQCKELNKFECELDSILFYVGKNAFLETKIDRIEFPRSVRILRGGLDVKTIFILTTPLNNGIQWIGNVLYGKSDLEIDSFDTIIYANKDIESILIPSNIKYIESFCFSKCINLKTVEFSPNSQLQNIGCFAFYKSAIESIIIPPFITSIEESAFRECNNLRHVEFLPNSKLQIIKKFAFYSSPIGSITIPRGVKTIESSAFSSCLLTKFDFENTSEIPHICSCALSFNPNLKEINVPRGSNITEDIFHRYDKTRINFI